MFSSRSVQIAAVFSDVFGQALPNLCRSFYNETKAEMFFSVFAVALLAEGVDRNSSSTGMRWAKLVALLAEGVDRNDQAMANTAAICGSPSSRRAWIEITAPPSTPRATPSPSSRRAWIEILISYTKISPNRVALLAEGVDRNRNLPPPSVCWPSRPPRGGRG